MAKLGSEKRPVIVRVRNQNRMEEIVKICKKNDWRFLIGIEPDEPEDISDLEKLLHPSKPMSTQLKTGRNESCHCGSGRKFKKCCLA